MEKTTKYPKVSGYLYNKRGINYIRVQFDNIYNADAKIAEGMGLGRQDGYSFVFNNIVVGGDEENPMMKLKQWTLTKSSDGGDPPFFKFLKILANSQTCNYYVDLAGTGVKGDGNDGAVVMDDSNLTLAAKMFISTMAGDIRDKESSKVMSAKNIDFTKILERLRQAFMDGTFQDALKNYGHNFTWVEKKYGLQLSPRNRKQIIATAIANGLTPQSPNWPSFVRSRQTWRRLGFYVCDDPECLTDANGNPVIDPKTGKPRELREAIMYPYDVAIPDKRKSNRLINQGLRQMGHQDLTARDVRVNGAELTQLADTAWRMAAGIDKGLHGIGYDISDVVEIPGSNMGQKFLDTMGLKNNLTGELNKSAEEYNDEKKGEFEKNLEKFKKDAETNPELMDKAKKLESDKVSAVLYNKALEAINEKLSQPGSQIKPFKVVKTMDEIDNFIMTVRNWAQSVVDQKKIAKYANVVADLVTCALCIQAGIGEQRINNIGDLAGAYSMLSSRNTQDEMFVDYVISTEDAMAEELDNMLTKITREEAKNANSQAQMVQPATVGVNEGVEQLNEFRFLKNMSKDEILNRLRKLVGVKEGAEVVSECKLTEAYLDMTRRMNSLGEYGYGRR